MESNLPSPTIYISSAETDVKFKNELISNLYSQNGNINIQESGFNFDSDITLIERTTSLIKRADLFLLLITPNYLKSRFAQKELELIISANREDGKRIIPIIYEDANIEGSPIANFAFTPQNGSPVINYQDKTEVYTQISNDIWSVVEATYNKKLLSILAETKKSHSTYLDLSKLDLNQIPFDLLEMDWLEELNLSRNQISRISNLDKLNKLNRLDLGFNKIEGISGLDKLDKLKYLNLAHNNISNTSNLESLGQLTILDLFENRIEKLENLGMNINLEFLGLSSNLLTDLSGMSHLFKLKKL